MREHVSNKGIRLLLAPELLTKPGGPCLDPPSWAFLRDAGVFQDEYALKLRLRR